MGQKKYIFFPTSKYFQDIFMTSKAVGEIADKIIYRDVKEVKPLSHQALHSGAYYTDGCFDTKAEFLGANAKWERGSMGQRGNVGSRVARADFSLGKDLIAGGVKGEAKFCSAEANCSMNKATGIKYDAEATLGKVTLGV